MRTSKTLFVILTRITDRFVADQATPKQEMDHVRPKRETCVIQPQIRCSIPCWQKIKNQRNHAMDCRHRTGRTQP